MSMFRVSRANLVGAVAGFLIYATMSNGRPSDVNLSSTYSNLFPKIPIVDTVSANPTLSNPVGGPPSQNTSPPTDPPRLPATSMQQSSMQQTSVPFSTVAGCSKSSEEDFCDAYAKKNGLIPLTTDVLHDKRFVKFKQQWLQHNCENFFKHKLICTSPVPKCINPTPVEEQPLIAVLAATTTRRVQQPAIHKIALFTLLLPSLVRTLDCGFRYVYMMGYDVSDPYYDNKAGLDEVTSWFSKEIQTPMKALGISVSLATVRVDNTVKKPGPVFLAMARRAYEMGADFFYRVNDDTEFRGHWPKAFTEALMSLPPPYGVIGPASLTSNLVILTHDFVHRTHMDIFQMDYYPPELPDWWMDNWVSRVYGADRTFYSQDAVVMHHTYAHGQRYEVNRGNQKYLPITLERGRGLIRSWMQRHNSSSEELKAFDNDLSHRGTFKFTEIKKLKSRPQK